MSDRKQLYFFTATFPYGVGEEFIDPELPYTIKEFDHVVIIPYYSKGKKKQISNHIEILERKRLKVPIMYFVGYVPLLARVLLSEFFYCKKKFFFIKRMPKWIRLYRNAVVDAFFVQSSCKDSTALYYTYWVNEWALPLALLKKRKRIKKIIGRSLGLDIWDTWFEEGYMPYRRFIYSQLAMIYPNSRIAEKYLKSLNFFPEKIEHSYLGTPMIGINPFPSGEEFVILSCSQISKLKRVELLAESIALLSIPVRWIHIGDGDQLNRVLEITKKFKSNIKFEFPGRVENFHQFLVLQPVNLFVTLSSSEGLPVTLQEAISAGIPVMGTNVGGVAEVICDQTGILLEEHPEINTVASSIEFFHKSKMNSEEFRESVIEYWKENFFAGNVYKDFYKNVKDL